MPHQPHPAQNMKSSLCSLNSVESSPEAHQLEDESQVFTGEEGHSDCDFFELQLGASCVAPFRDAP